MKVFLLGAGFNNKGAQLMLLTVCEILHNRFPDIVLCISPAEASAEQAAKYRLKLTKEYLLHTGANQCKFQGAWRWPTLFTFVRRLFGKSSFSGQVSFKEVDVVLDLSGLAYSDKWGENPVRNLSYLTRLCRKNGVKYVMMPQAFGPFKDNQLRVEMGKAINQVDLAFARDAESRGELESLPSVDGGNIRVCSDITHLIDADSIASNPRFEDPYFVVVPNARMLDKAGPAWKSNYLDFLMAGMLFVMEKTSLKLVLMVHSTTSGADSKLADQLLLDLKQKYGARVTMFTDKDPLILKQVLKYSSFLIGSRYHALVSSLSSGTPAIGTSWQHKYQLLFKEYGISQRLMLTPDSDLREQLESFIDPTLLADERTAVMERSKQVKEQVQEKIEEVYQILDEVE